MSNFLDRMQEEEKKKKELELVEKYKQQAESNELLNKHHITPVDSRYYAFFKTTGTLFLILMMIAILGYFYLSWNGNYKSLTSLACGNLSLSCEKQTCNPILTCPDCNCATIPDCSCPSVSLNCGNQT